MKNIDSIICNKYCFFVAWEKKGASGVSVKCGRLICFLPWLIIVAGIVLLSLFCVSLARERDEYRQEVSVLSGQLEQLRQELAGNNALPLAEILEYQNLYPEMYCEVPTERKISENTVYLTFDDGPSDNTPKILAILKKYNIKATFFVTGQTDKNSQAIMEQIVDEGHTIGVHTYSHQYETIYTSVESYLDDFYKIYTLIYEATGVYPEIFRFPGGSINAYNSHCYQQIIAEMLRRGFTFYDWNVSADDALPKATVYSIINKATSGIDKADRLIILMHDGYKMTKTVQALPQIIDKHKEAGYEFSSLTNNDLSMSFTYID